MPLCLWAGRLQKCFFTSWVMSKLSPEMAIFPDMLRAPLTRTNLAILCVASSRRRKTPPGQGFGASLSFGPAVAAKALQVLSKSVLRMQKLDGESNWVTVTENDDFVTQEYFDAPLPSYSMHLLIQPKLATEDRMMNRQIRINE